jgi:hypothetical protein
MYNSVSLLVIKYTEYTDIKRIEDFYDPNVYSKVLTLKLDTLWENGLGYHTEFLSFNDGYNMLIKSFELTDSNNKVFYYIPYTTPLEYQNSGYNSVINLPISVSVDDNKIGYSFTIIRK